ncbi:DegQ family serine endoprotease [Candidatus Albibeggiatoa sp. nov. NOAA]|uniref:DegQ family serine endoprotease n=1 Tax=Candidatus Albibeggiatoa sp. nov. NOAA TaxID=3162724 RepID=UPI0032FFDC60|nr:DegQ family serine endoprotease [Thiotrichaceae bacterium]
MQRLKQLLWIPLLFLAFSSVQARSLPEFTGLVEQYGPAVVNISTTAKKSDSLGSLGRDIPDIPEDSPLHDFFRRFFDEEEMRSQPSTSLGSGFIISSDGYVVTNHHVIDNAKEIIVKLTDRRELEAEVIGSDKRSDLALLKIEADDLPTVQLGSSDKLKVGEWVLAIGSPFGFDHSATAGIVSATGRSLPNDNYIPFIQTDVAINPGNSGGPLFNMDGEVVGVNAQIYSRTGGFMGLSFAIPVDVMNNVVDQLKNDGKVVRGWLGVLIQDVTRDLAESFNMDKPQGALVAQVLPDSPAEDAKFKSGDIITKFNNQIVERSSDLPPLVGSTKVNHTVSVEIIRKGKKKMLRVKIGELPSEDELENTSNRGSKSFNSEEIGLSIKDLDDEQKEEMSITSGVLVKKVQSGVAYDAGIRTNDVILEINHTSIDNVRHFKQVINQLPKGRSIPILVLRRGSPRFLALKIPE